MAKAKKSSGAKVRGKTKSKVGKVSAKASAKASPRKVSGRAAKKTKATGLNVLKSQDTGAVLEYKLFVEDSVRNLEDQVNYHISKGWSPVGGVVLQGSSHFLQSMVRRQD